MMVAKIARVLLGSEEMGGSGVQRITLRDVATQSCISREQLMLVLKYFENQQIIRVEPRRIVITDLQGLKSSGLPPSRRGTR